MRPGAERADDVGMEHEHTPAESGAIEQDDRRDAATRIDAARIARRRVPSTRVPIFHGENDPDGALARFFRAQPEPLLFAHDEELRAWAKTIPGRRGAEIAARLHGVSLSGRVAFLTHESTCFDRTEVVTTLPGTVEIRRFREPGHEHTMCVRSDPFPYLLHLVAEAALGMDERTRIRRVFRVSAMDEWSRSG